MFRKIVLGAGAILIALAACKAKKDTTQTPVSNNTTTTIRDNDPVIKLEEVNITPPPPEKPKHKVYRATNARSSDILHTKLEVKFDWQNSWLFGKATIDIKPYFYSTSKLYLNARGMEIYKVQLVKNASFTDLKYVYENDSLKIDLDKNYTRDEKYTVFIDYKSKPDELKKGGSSAITSDKGLYFINPKGIDPDKMPQIWTQGETQSNSAWFPTVDSPNEKMTEEIYMTVEDKYVTLSNGVLKSQKKNADGTRTDHWVMDLPHAPYLVMMGIGEFKIVKDSWKGKDVWYYVEKEYEPYAKAIFGNTPEMIEFYSKKLGVEFPWQKYSQIVVRDYVSGAMENTTATVHGDMLYSTDRELIDGDQEDIIAHELFHQWFGDLVTCESWSNLTLNESFATYGEYLWNEYKYGRDDADAAGYMSRSVYMAESRQKMENLVRFDYKAREDMFDGHSYNKGGQILNMLRRHVGDDAFFASLKLYLERYKFQPAEAHMLRLCFEEVTGEDFNWFFNQWYYGKGHPTLKIETSYDEAAKKIVIKTSQLQDFSEGIPLFTLPLKVDIYSNGQVTRKMIWIKEADQTHELTDVATKPDLVNVDADKTLLAEKHEKKTLDEYVFQYKNAPLYLDRYEALEFIKTQMKDPRAYETAKLALNDKYHGLRTKAIKMLADQAESKKEDLKPLILQLAKTDTKSTVRADALHFIHKHYNGNDMKDLYLVSLKDKSPDVNGTALSALASVDSTLALAKAKELESDKSTSVLYSVMDVYSRFGGDDQLNFFISRSKDFTGFGAIGYYNMFGQFLKRVSDDNLIKSATFIKDKLKGNSNKFVAYYAQKAIKDQANRFEEKETDLNTKITEAKQGGKSTSELEAQLAKTKSVKDQLLQIYEESKK